MYYIYSSRCSEGLRPAYNNEVLLYYNYAEAVLGYNLTEIYEFNSHRTSNLHLLTVEELPKQVTDLYKIVFQ